MFGEGGVGTVSNLTIARFVVELVGVLVLISNGEKSVLQVFE